MLSLRRARQLLQPRLRREAGLFLAEGPHLLESALRTGVELRTVFATERAAVDGETARLIQECTERGIPVALLPDADLAQVTATEAPQGVVSVAPVPPPGPLPFGVVTASRPRVESPPQDDADELWLYLDAVQDPGNVGTLLRAAEAFGLHGALLGKGTADAWSGKVVRSAQGAHFGLRVLAERYDHFEPAAVLDALARREGELWVTSLGGDDLYAAPAVPSHCIVAVGNEAQGVRPFLDHRASRRLRVPQRGRSDSLNVAMAATVVLSWLTR